MRLFQGLHNCVFYITRANVASYADVLRGPAPRGAGTRDEPIRSSAWEARASEARGYGQ